MGRLEAQKDVRRIATKYGADINIVTGAISERDDYGHVISRANTTITVKTFPVRFKPTQKQREKAGILKAVDVIFWLPLRSFDLAGYTYDQIEVETGKIVFESKTYKIIEKNRVNHFADSFLHIVIGANRG